MNVKLDGYVQIDSREQDRVKPALKHFYRSKVSKLDCGDYVYNGKVAIEYKKCDTDLFSSIVNKSLFNQVARMVQTYPIHYVMIEGNPIEYIIKHHRDEHFNFSTNQWDGTYTSLSQITNVVFCYNFKHGLQLMSLLFKKASDNKNRVYNYITKTENTAVNFMMCKLGIGQNIAELVAEELNLSTWKDLDLLDKDLLCSINGIGEKKASLIMEAIG